MQLSIKAPNDSISVASIINQVCEYNKALIFCPLANKKVTGGGTGVESDPISDSSTCERDIPYFKQLGINTIRPTMMLA
jgi:hypothetical protein